jgi:hypothetical protein
LTSWQQDALPGSAVRQLTRFAGGLDEGPCVHEAAEGIGLEEGVLYDATGRRRMQRLKVQGADAADPHRGVGVEVPGH